MILYHLDRNDTFPCKHSEQLIYPVETTNTYEADEFFRSIYPKGISTVGKRYLDSFYEELSAPLKAIDTYNNARVHTIEYVFEMVRLFHFPNRPSRFTSLFACKDIKGVKMWYNYLVQNKHDINMSKATIKKIKTSQKTFTGDAFWRDQPLTLESDGNKLPVFSPFAYHMWAIHYWNGDSTNSPRPEVLCELPVDVIDSFPVPDFFSRFPY